MRARYGMFPLIAATLGVAYLVGYPAIRLAAGATPSDGGWWPFLGGPVLGIVGAGIVLGVASRWSREPLDAVVLPLAAVPLGLFVHVVAGMRGLVADHVPPLIDTLIAAPLLEEVAKLGAVGLLWVAAASVRHRRSLLLGAAFATGALFGGFETLAKMFAAQASHQAHPVAVTTVLFMRQGTWVVHGLSAAIAAMALPCLARNPRRRPLAALTCVAAALAFHGANNLAAVALNWGALADHVVWMHLLFVARVWILVAAGGAIWIGLERWLRR